MALVWAAYLRKIDIFRPEKWGWVILSFFAGTLTVIPVFAIDLPEFTVTQSGYSFWDMLVYYTWNVGFMEEVVKFAGLLLVWVIFRRRIFTETPNYIIHASLVALGFATVENFIYFSNYGVHLVYMRGMMSTFSHMVGSAIVVSFFYFGMKRGVLWCILYTIAGLVIAALEHGLYDTFLTYKFINLPFLGILLNLTVYLISIELYVRLLNNFMNLSQLFDPQKCIDRKLVQRLLFLVFFIAGGIQFAGLVAKYGLYMGFYSNIGMLLQEVGFTLILVTRMSRYTFIPRRWFPVYPLLPITIRTVPVYNPVTRETDPATYFTIRGDEFNEYPYTKNLYRTVLLSPLSVRGRPTIMGEPFYAIMREKVFLGKDEIFYRMEMRDTDLGFEGKHPTQFLLKPKVRGTSNVNKQPIAGFMLLPPEGYTPDMDPQTLQYLEWVVLDSVGDGTPKKRWNLLQKIFA